MPKSTSYKRSSKPGTISPGGTPPSPRMEALLFLIAVETLFLLFVTVSISKKIDNINIKDSQLGFE